MDTLQPAIMYLTKYFILILRATLDSASISVPI